MQKTFDPRTEPVTMRMRKSIKIALDIAAKNVSRPRANMAEFIIAEWLRANGYLKDKR